MPKRNYKWLYVKRKSFPNFLPLWVKFTLEMFMEPTQNYTSDNRKRITTILCLLFNVRRCAPKAEFREISSVAVCH